MSVDQFALLGHPTTAKEAHTAWRKAALSVHPDKSDDPDAHGAFLALGDARDAVIKALDSGCGASERSGARRR